MFDFILLRTSDTQETVEHMHCLLINLDVQVQNTKDRTSRRLGIKVQDLMPGSVYKFKKKYTFCLYKNIALFIFKHTIYWSICSKFISPYIKIFLTLHINTWTKQTFLNETAVGVCFLRLWPVCQSSLSGCPPPPPRSSHTPGRGPHREPL